MDEVINYLKAELTRVQNERDTAQANERQQMRIVAELRQQVGLMLGVIELVAQDSRDNDTVPNADGLDEVVARVTQSETRIADITKTRAVV